MRPRALEQRGSVLVFTAVAMQALLLVLAFALEVGNWYVHERQLQNRVDNAAFAAALAYGYAFPGCTESSAQGTALANGIVTTAKQYAGDDGVPGAVNTGVNDQAKVDVVVNSTDLNGPDGSDSAPSPVVGHPCYMHPTDIPAADFTSPDGGYWVDVKARETDVASLFGGFGFTIPSLAKRARILLMDTRSATRLRPLAVADPRTTRCARAILRGDSDVTVDLAATDSTGLNWSSDPTAYTVPSTGDDTGQVPIDIVLGDAGCVNTVTYPDVGRLTTWDTGASPKLEQVQLGGSGGSEVCLTGHFVPRPDLAVTPPGTPPPCQVTVTVWPRFNTIGVDPPTVTFRGQTLEWDGINPITFSPFSVTSGQGNVDLDFELRNQGVTTPVLDAAWVNAGNDVAIGPIQNLAVSGDGEVQRRFFEGQDLPDLEISLNLRPLRSDIPSHIPAVIRASPQDVRNLSAAVNCGGSLPTNIEEGCAAPLTKGGDVPGYGGNNTGSLVSSYNALWAPGGVCTSNNWGNYLNAAPNGIPRNDRRLITVPLTQMGSRFSPIGNPSEPYPITAFAAFYVTGWHGDPGCAGNESYPWAAVDEGNPGANAIWGHFIKFVLPSGSGTPASSGTPANDICTWIGEDDIDNRNDVSACIASLVR